MTSSGTYSPPRALAGAVSSTPRAAIRRRRRICIGLRWASSVRTHEQIAHAEVVTVCVTGATGFIGAHVAQLASQATPVRVTYREEARLNRLGDAEVEPVRADVLDRASLRRAFRGCDTVFHCAGYVGSHPADRVWRVNALSPRIAVEAAAAEGVGRVVVTSSVAGIGPAPPGETGTEADPYRGGGPGLAYPDAKHEGEAEALAAGAPEGVDVAN